MTPLQICLIIVGVILIIGSFFLSDKLSDKEVDKLSRLSSAQLQRVVDRQLEDIEDRVADIVTEAVENSVDQCRRPMEALSNEKIMAIQEFSDTVMDAINKNHTEIMFLYSMLNDKQEDIKNMVATIDRSKSQLRELTDKVQLSEVKNPVEKKPVEKTPIVKAPIVGSRISKPVAPATQATTEIIQDISEEDSDFGGFIFREDVEAAAEEPVDVREEMIRLYNEGISIVEIGKRLNRGIGEVKLVIDIANHGGNNEA